MRRRWRSRSRFGFSTLTVSISLASPSFPFPSLRTLSHRSNTLIPTPHHTNPTHISPSTPFSCQSAVLVSEPSFITMPLFFLLSLLSLPLQTDTCSLVCPRKAKDGTKRTNGSASELKRRQLNEDASPGPCLPTASSSPPPHTRYSPFFRAHKTSREAKAPSKGLARAFSSSAGSAQVSRPEIRSCPTGRPPCFLPRAPAPD